MGCMVTIPKWVVYYCFTHIITFCPIRTNAVLMAMTICIILHTYLVFGKKQQHLPLPLHNYSWIGDTHVFILITKHIYIYILQKSIPLQYANPLSSSPIFTSGPSFSPKEIPSYPIHGEPRFTILCRRQSATVSESQQKRFAQVVAMAEAKTDDGWHRLMWCKGPWFWYHLVITIDKPFLIGKWRLLP